MKIRVRFFAMCRDLVQRDVLEMELPEPATGDDFWNRIVVQFPQLAPYQQLSRLAVNLEYVPNSIQIEDGDEISIIPPVSGG
ncbi:MoaD/ThiS family protein [bacterium]|nr:MoaD/ThiS family protein [bacterium]